MIIYKRIFTTQFLFNTHHNLFFTCYFALISLSKSKPKQPRCDSTGSFSVCSSLHHPADLNIINPTIDPSQRLHKGIWNIKCLTNKQTPQAQLPSKNSPISNWDNASLPKHKHKHRYIQTHWHDFHQNLRNLRLCGIWFGFEAHCMTMVCRFVFDVARSMRDVCLGRVSACVWKGWWFDCGNDNEFGSNIGRSRSLVNIFSASLCVTHNTIMLSMVSSSIATV